MSATEILEAAKALPQKERVKLAQDFWELVAENGYEAELTAEVARHPDAREIVWVQEEPDNMGALSFVVPRLRRLFPERKVLSIKRSAAASPATGSAKAHDLEQKTLISLALRDEGK